jgi:hypothetical protein
MINIGELYYFAGLLENVDQNDSNKIKIFGLEEFDTQDPSFKDQISTLKDKFIYNYKNAMYENEMFFCEQIWEEITGIRKLSTKRIKSLEQIPVEENILNGLFSLLNQWFENQISLTQVLSSIKIYANSSTEIYTLYYGLLVLDFFSRFYQTNTTKFDSKLDNFIKEHLQHLESKKILAICKPYFSTLFKMSGIETLNFLETDSYHQIHTKISEKVALDAQGSIKLIISIDLKGEILSQLEKKFEDIIFAPIEYHGVEYTKVQKSVFATIAKNTLGLTEAWIKEESLNLKIDKN